MIIDIKTLYREKEENYQNELKAAYEQI